MCMSRESVKVRRKKADADSVLRDLKTGSYCPRTAERSTDRLLEMDCITYWSW